MFFSRYNASRAWDLAMAELKDKRKRKFEWKCRSGKTIKMCVISSQAKSALSEGNSRALVHKSKNDESDRPFDLIS